MSIRELVAPAARYQHRELAHAEALLADLGPAPDPRGAPQRFDAWCAELSRHREMTRAEFRAVSHLLCAPCRGTGLTSSWHVQRICPQCRGDGQSALARQI